MGLEFHVWPTDWVASVTSPADQFLVAKGGLLDEGDISDLRNLALRVTGDPGQADQLLETVLAQPRFASAVTAAARERVARAAPPQQAQSTSAVEAAMQDAVGRRPVQSVQRQPHSEWIASAAGPVREALSELTQETMRQEAAPSASTPAIGDVAAELAALARSSSAEIRAGVASNPRTPTDVLEFLAQDAEETVRFAVRSALGRTPVLRNETRLLSPAGHEPPPPPTAPGSASSAAHSQRSSSLWRKYAPVEESARLASHASIGVRLVVARNPETPPAVLASLASDGLNGVMQAVAGNPSTPPSTLGTLATDPKALLARRRRRDRVSEKFHLRQVRRAAAANPFTPPPTLEALATEPWLAEVLIGNPATPSDALRTLAADILARPGSPTMERDKARNTAARNPAMPTETLQEVGRGAGPHLGRLLAGNPNCPPDVLTALAETSIAPSGHWSRPPSQLLFQRAIASNSRATPAALDLLARSGDAEVLGTVVAHPSATAAILAHVRSRLASTKGA